jgi:hypothetical protein
VPSLSVFPIHAVSPDEEYAHFGEPHRLLVQHHTTIDCVATDRGFSQLRVRTTGGGIAQSCSQDESEQKHATGHMLIRHRAEVNRTRILLLVRIVDVNRRYHSLIFNE